MQYRILLLRKKDLLLQYRIVSRIFCFNIALLIKKLKKKENHLE